MTKDTFLIYGFVIRIKGRRRQNITQGDSSLAVMSLPINIKELQISLPKSLDPGKEYPRLGRGVSPWEDFWVLHDGSVSFIAFWASQGHLEELMRRGTESLGGGPGA